MKIIKLGKNVALKNNAPFRSCISYLDTVISKYNLLECSQNYSTTSANLWNYYRDQIDNINDNASDGKSFKYKTKIVGQHKHDLEMKNMKIDQQYLL